GSDRGPRAQRRARRAVGLQYGRRNRAGEQRRRLRRAHARVHVRRCEEPAGIALERRQLLHAGADDHDLPQHQVRHADPLRGQRRAAPAPRRRLHPRRIPLLAGAPLLLGGLRLRGRLKAIYKQFLRWLGVAAAASGLAVGLARTDWHRSLENVYYDYWHVVSGVRYEPQHTVFITVDDAALVAYKDDPLAFWAPYWAQAINVLRQAGVKVVGLDFIYMVSAESWLG